MINWNVHEENIAILGLQGSGKTTLAKNLLGSIPNTPRLIISPQNPQGLYGSYGIPVREIKDIQQNGAMLWVGKTDENTFENICNHVMAHLTNTVMVIDDCHEFCKKQKMPKAWATLINSGRNRGITSIFISPSPNLVHNNVLQSVHHLFSFRFVLESQIEFAQKNFFGTAAYVLMPKSTRPTRFQNIQYEAGKHDYLYRSISQTEIEFTQDGKTFVVYGQKVEEPE